jgi:CRISPR system Cascade subunit CasE
MYLTRMRLNLRDRGARRDLGSPYEMHRTLARLFAAAPAGARERVLFRVEPGSETVLVQSQTVPSLAVLPTGYCRAAPECRADYGELLQSLRAGQRLRFRLLANPTVKRDGKRLSLFAPEAQQAWLARKLAAAGAALEGATAAPQGLQRSHKGAAHGEGQQTHFAVLFDGLLQVTDPAALRRAVAAGVGSAKGYGFGLLSLAPA